MPRRQLPPSQRPERQKTPEALRDWVLRYRKHSSGCGSASDYRVRGSVDKIL
jgi:hypothetical protein